MNYILVAIIIHNVKKERKEERKNEKKRLKNMYQKITVTSTTAAAMLYNRAKPVYLLSRIFSLTRTVFSSGTVQQSVYARQWVRVFLFYYIFIIMTSEQVFFFFVFVVFSFYISRERRAVQIALCKCTSTVRWAHEA